MLQMNHQIIFMNGSKKFELKLLHSVEITTSVDNLVDTCTIILPESIMNNVLDLNDKIYRGTQVVVRLGYNNRLNTEFVGYVLDSVNKSGSLTITCEDALFVFRSSVPDKVIQPAPVKDILQYVIDQVDPTFQLVSDSEYGVTYEKFTIHNAEGYDVLKKLQEELKANIFFDTNKKELHFHAPYKKKRGEVKYDMSRNVENTSLEYKRTRDKKVEVIVESTNSKGEVKQITAGTTGGEKVTMKVGAMSEADMRKVADVVLQQSNADRYEGTIDTWLIPFVQPTYSANFVDNDYADQNGKYYIIGVKTSFSPSGGRRTITFGIKL